MRGVSSSQPVIVHDLENSTPDLGDTHVNTTGATANIKAFMVDGEPLPTTDRVKPWREGHRGKVAKCVGKTLLFPKDMNH